MNAKRLKFYRELISFLQHEKSPSKKRVREVLHLAKEARPNVPGRFTLSMLRALKRGSKHPRPERYFELWERLQTAVDVDTEPTHYLRASFGILKTITFVPTVRSGSI